MTSNKYLKYIFISSLIVFSFSSLADTVSTPLPPSVELLEEIPKAHSPQVGSVSQTMTYAEISTTGLSNGCYPTPDHYVAEYLYQNPKACFWSNDTVNETVTTLPVPKPPANAVILPPPSGGNDTAMLQSIINANDGGSVVGTGTYIVNQLKIQNPIDIFDMPITTPSGATEVVYIESPDVRIFNSPIDAKNSNTVHIGYYVKDGSHRFTLVNSGLSNVSHKQQKNAAGVFLRDVDDFHLACNTFENITNDTSDKTKTARANAFWMAGGKQRKNSGGVIANNYAENLQSNGNLKDAEFFTEANYDTTFPPIRIFANRGISAGKRLTKHQANDALVLSNYYDWPEKPGPLGNRTLYSMVNVQFSSNITVRNNRFKVAAEGRFDYIFHLNGKWKGVVPDSIHFDCNDIEIRDKKPVSSGNISQVIAARNSAHSSTEKGLVATNSSANNNHVYGEGDLVFHYWFGPGYPPNGGAFETIGNIFSVPATRREYK